MSRSSHRFRLWLALLAGALLAMALVVGCAANRPTQVGAVLWADHCGRCHNLREPAEFSASEWTVIVHHMRLRAPLTGEQEKAIQDFLTAK